MQDSAVPAGAVRSKGLLRLQYEDPLARVSTANLERNRQSDDPGSDYDRISVQSEALWDPIIVGADSCVVCSGSHESMKGYAAGLASVLCTRDTDTLT